MEKVESYYLYGGWQEVWSHSSETLDCSMKFAIYLPEQAKEKKLPVLYYLSGLTCTEQNVMTKSGIQRYASEQGVIIVMPDTSPRGEQVADSPDYDLGQGAGFYVNATQSPWNKHYQMYHYILNELPHLIENNFPVTGKKSIMGHSMGGHGALVLALKNPEKYVSVSAFSPIVSPSSVAWGEKAFGHYLGENKQDWKKYDAVNLILEGNSVEHILVDQGLADNFYQSQLKTELLENACKQMNVNIDVRYHQNYDHSYYFIASFIEDHVRYHSERLNASLSQ
ncbi:S-formylglutathione hydrolase frmB [Phocoenobacter uteri]|uniref:S-formylglutathione hydrolase n=1 Tax=Phocoenobacter uteri TaxID=146806 RepID=A0A379C7K1_9PAST|nr:S-formylglutathione hydrolase [Phocoenobacter uteri]MDG6882042.1 S-formylglutathione hydrolase [Phocoenobacter uteri]SUB58191.1 S-formylglutathione hydrolase frmB [Phocoenobacter uteri]